MASPRASTPVAGKAGAYFTPDLFAFLGDLAAHNERDWFEAHKQRYLDSVRDPFLRFVADLQPRLKKISPHLVADPRPVGGSMMRIHRDTRFAKDKSPYKTAVMAQFWHDRGEEGATPGFYLRLQPGDSMVGAGVWHPEPGALQRIRTAIVDDPKGWKRAKEGRELRAACGLAGESLRRPPRGFPADHPFVEDLKRKDFATRMPLVEKQVTRPGFMDELLDDFRSLAPFLSFICKAIGLPF